MAKTPSDSPPAAVPDNPPPAYEEHYQPPQDQTSGNAARYIDDPEAVDEHSPNNETRHVGSTRRTGRLQSRAGFKFKLIFLTLIFVFIGYKVTSTTTKHIDHVHHPHNHHSQTTKHPHYGCNKSKHNKHNPNKHHAAALSTEPTDGRTQVIRSLFSSITGTYELYDMLHLETITGSIAVTINPHPGTSPAVLKVYSSTGSITVSLPSDYLTTVPLLLDQRSQGVNHTSHDDILQLASTDRIFDTEIRTHTGSIQVTYLVGGGGRTEITSQTGRLDLDLRAVNVGPKDPVSTLHTRTSPAGQTIEVSPFNPAEGRGEMTAKLRGDHLIQGVGNLDVTYPKNWEGTLEAKMQGWGAVSVDGDDLVIDEAEVPGFVRAHRGDHGEAVTLTKQGLGPINFQC